MVQLLAPKFLGSKSLFSSPRHGTIINLQTTTKTDWIFRQSQKEQYQLIIKVLQGNQIITASEDSSAVVSPGTPRSRMDFTAAKSTSQCFTGTYYSWFIIKYCETLTIGAISNAPYLSGSSRGKCSESYGPSWSLHFSTSYTDKYKASSPHWLRVSVPPLTQFKSPFQSDNQVSKVVCTDSNQTYIRLQRSENGLLNPSFVLAPASDSQAEASQ